MPGVLSLIEELAIRFPGDHRVDDLFRGVIPDKHDDLQEARTAVEPEVQFTLGMLVV